MGDLDRDLVAARSRAGLVLTLLEELREDREGEEAFGSEKIAAELERLGTELTALAHDITEQAVKKPGPGVVSTKPAPCSTARPLVLMLDTAGSILACNSERGASSTRSDLGGDPAVKAIVGEVLAPGAPSSLLLRRTNHRGAPILVSSLALRGSQGEVESILLTVVPEGEPAPPTCARDRLVVDGPLPMWALDRRTLGFVTVNRAMVREYGYTRDELLEMRLPDLSPAAEKAEVVKSLATWSGGDELRFRGRHRIHDGSMVDVEMTMVAAELGGAPIATGVCWTATRISGSWPAAKRA